MDIPIYTIQSKAEDYPEVLGHIADPPAQLHVQGKGWPALLRRGWVAIIGSRKVSSYGKAVTMRLAGELARAGLVIVSGLAYGVDSIAHRAALDAGGYTVAVMAGGLDRIYPASHQQLARDISVRGGAVISEYAAGQAYWPQNFIARNRLISGLSRAVIITEAGQKSGTLHTVRFALEQGREVFAVPGDITSSNSITTNRLIKSGASPLTEAEDVLRLFNLERRETPKPQGTTPAEKLVLDLLFAGEADGEQLCVKSGLPPNIFNQTLTMLEVTGRIKPLGGNKWSLG